MNFFESSSRTKHFPSPMTHLSSHSQPKANVGCPWKGHRTILKFTSCDPLIFDRTTEQFNDHLNSSYRSSFVTIIMLHYRFETKKIEKQTNAASLIAWISLHFPRPAFGPWTANTTITLITGERWKCTIM